MNVLRTSVWSFILICLPFIANAQEVTDSGIPTWVIEDWESKVKGTGIWIAPNPYESEEIPYDSYAMQWQYGPGNTTMKGRLFAMKNGKDVYTLWEFLVYWHPAEKKLITIQYGKNPNIGNLAIGEEIPTREKEVSKSISTVYAADGSSFRAGHENTHKGNEIHSNSFNIVDGKWVPRGSFVWTLKTE